MAKDDASGTDDNGKGGKDAVLADLATERDRRQAAEAKIKELQPLADKAKQLEDDKLGETEKLTNQIAELTDRLGKETARADRYEVALDKGLNLTRAKRLVGSTVEELAKDADDLIADLGDSAGKPKPPAGGKPTENLRGGGAGDVDPPVDTRKIVDSIPRGF